MLRLFAAAMLAIFLAFPLTAGEAKPPTPQPIEAPFGFAWGQTADDILGSGINLSLDPDTGSNVPGIVTWYLANEPPVTPGIPYNGILLAISDAHGLQKVVFFGTMIRHDPLGDRGKAEYSRIKSLLTQKYGSPVSSLEETGVVLYQDAGEFYQCLAYVGCGFWQTYWEDRSGSTIILKLNGRSRGEGWVRMSYEGPVWLDVLSAIRAAKEKKDLRAF